MLREKILRSSLFLCVGFSILAMWFKLMHKPGGEPLLLLSMLSAIVFVVTAAPEVMRSAKINFSEKIMWIVGFIFLTAITGLIYVFRARKRTI